ncbi:MAG: proton-conducting transporter membrane subunit [Desulfurococcus sp.]
MPGGLPVETLPALTVYLLIGGSFTLILFKALRVKASILRVYSGLYLVFAVASALLIYLEARKSVLIYVVGGFPSLIGIAYEVDLFSASMGLIIAVLSLAIYPLLGILDSILNEYTMALYLGLVAGLLGVTYTGDLFNSFVMLEVFTISMLGLIAARNTVRAYKAALRYGLLALVTGLIYFLGATLMYFAVGALNMGYIATWNTRLFILGKAIYASLPLESVILFILILMTWSLIAEEALVPLHFWLPEAYSAASPAVAGLLAGVSEAAGYYLLLRLYYTLYSAIPEPVALMLRVLGVITIIIGGFGILYSDRLLSMISYSVILDTGYIAIAASLGPSGVPVVLAYVVAHAVVKPLLFITGGWAVINRGNDKLISLQGVFRGSRIMQLGFVTGAVAVIGIPPTVLFSAKLELYINLFNAMGADPSLILSLIVSLLGSGLALAGFIKAVSVTVLSYSDNVVRPRGVVEAYVLVFTIIVIALGVAYSIVAQGFIEPASQSLIYGRLNYVMKALSAIGR